ncbi:Fic family protein [Phytoactinopolyspora endophytica]|uniref:Fic family protein n=1 Tax=Phytoactinopolyspora endophytica TaxID=1642495 RepID=UPI00197BA7E5|nr:Fic family protein [Phytoactinopolyspora endophytica]
MDPGDTTPWHASFWEFCARYCAERFSDQWHLSPEQSLLLHAENTVIPRQVVIYTPRGTNNTLQLPFETSLYDLKEGQLPPRNDVTERDGLVLYTPEAALTRVSESFFTRYPVEAQVALAGVPEATDMLRRLLNGGHSTIAGRLAGAMRRIERPEVADVILGSMRAAGYDVRETDPFTPSEVLGTRKTTPIVSRLQAMWETFREPVIDLFPSPPGLPSDQESYLQYVDEIYKSDAYHSLSIEGYRVTPVLVERVRSGQWDPDGHATDKQSSDALAARGYWQAFQLVRDAVSRIVAGEDAVDVVITSHRDWYLELFQPCVAAGLVQASVLAGYRNDAVFLRGSRHVPPRPSSVRDAVPTLFNLLKDEPEPSVRAVLGHWMFGYIHPYPDGNGRMARFLMNAMLATGGYPWTVVRVDDRDAYMAALEEASIGADIRPFAAFIATCVADSEQLKDRH